MTISNREAQATGLLGPETVMSRAAPAAPRSAEELQRADAMYADAGRLLEEPGAMGSGLRLLHAIALATTPIFPRLSKKIRLDFDSAAGEVAHSMFPDGYAAMCLSLDREVAHRILGQTLTTEVPSTRRSQPSASFHFDALLGRAREPDGLVAEAGEVITAELDDLHGVKSVRWEVITGDADGGLRISGPVGSMCTLKVGRVGGPVVLRARVNLGFDLDGCWNPALTTTETVYVMRRRDVELGPPSWRPSSCPTYGWMDYEPRPLPDNAGIRAAVYATLTHRALALPPLTLHQLLGAGDAELLLPTNAELLAAGARFGEALAALFDPALTGARIDQAIARGVELGLPRRPLTAALGELAEDGFGQPRDVTASSLGAALRGLQLYYDAIEAERRRAGRHTPTQRMLTVARSAARSAAWEAGDGDLEALVLTLAVYPRFGHELAG
jgi:hypothetical protein